VSGINRKREAMEFIELIFKPEGEFLRNGLLGGILAGIAFGIIGSYVVIRRISYIAGAISHSILGGIGASLFLQGNYEIAWFPPLLGAVLAALSAALLIGFVSLYLKERSDTIISAIWVIGMAVGILLFSKTPGYNDLMSYLFGNILLISTNDVWMILGLDIVIILIFTLFYNKLLALSFDEKFAQLRGVRANLFYILLLCIIALSVVFMVRIVGIVMVIALLTLPAAAAGQFAKKLWQMILIAIFISLGCVCGGFIVSYNYDLPSGATIVILAGIVYLLAVFVNSIKK